MKSNYKMSLINYQTRVNNLNLTKYSLNGILTNTPVSP